MTIEKSAGKLFTSVLRKQSLQPKRACSALIYLKKGRHYGALCSQGWSLLCIYNCLYFVYIKKGMFYLLICHKPLKTLSLSTQYYVVMKVSGNVWNSHL